MPIGKEHRFVSHTDFRGSVFLHVLLFLVVYMLALVSAYGQSKSAASKEADAQADSQTMLVQGAVTDDRAGQYLARSSLCITG